MFTGGHDAGAAYRGVANTRAGAAGLFIRAGEARAGVSTAQAYHLCDTAPNLRAPDRFGMLGALLSEDLESIGRLAGNVFEQVIDVPERVRIKALMREYGTARRCMSGSGPTVFGCLIRIRLRRAAQNISGQLCRMYLFAAR